MSALRVIAFCVAVTLITACNPVTPTTPTYPDVPKEILIQLIQAEDTRTWNAAAMAKLLGDGNPRVRSRAALAAGRIGDEGAVPELIKLLKAAGSMVAGLTEFATLTPTVTHRFFLLRLTNNIKLAFAESK